MKSSEFLPPEKVPPHLFRIVDPERIRFNKKGLLFPHTWDSFYKFYIPTAHLEDIDKIAELFYAMSIWTVVKNPEFLLLMIDTALLDIEKVRYREVPKIMKHGEFLVTVPKQAIKKVDAFSAIENPETGLVVFSHQGKRELK